jgi:hypothetical protein
MKDNLTFELSLDKYGEFCIKFKHHDKSKLLTQKCLKKFIDKATDKGLILVKLSGYLDDNESFADYEIQIQQ